MSKTPKAPAFEDALAELEKIVANMEAGQLPLEESLAAYKRGTELLKFCQQKLQDAESQVRVLTEANQLENFPGDNGS
ncbi:MAG: exodeoxyribonuclease VII small subunit [Burkholderiales bacterium]